MKLEKLEKMLKRRIKAVDNYYGNSNYYALEGLSSAVTALLGVRQALAEKNSLESECEALMTHEEVWEHLEDENK